MVTIRSVSLKTTKMTIRHPLLLCYKDLDSVPYLLALFLFFQESLGSVVGVLAAVVHLPLEGWCVFHCTVQYVVLPMEQKCFLPDCHCSALEK